MAEEPAGGVKLEDKPPTLETKPIDQDDPIFKNAVLTEVNKQLTTALGERKQDNPVAPTIQPLSPLPTDPLDLLGAKEREELEGMKLTNPTGYAQIYANLSTRLSEERVRRQAAPIVAAQAKSLVQGFKYDKSVTEKPELFRAIAPIFDARMAQVTDLSPLVGMTEAQRNTELGLRWDSAKAEVLEKLASAPAPKPEPTLLSPSGPTGAAPGTHGTENDKFEDDDWVQAMKKEYNLTDEQIRELAKANV